jgi:hypothetical protein
MRSEFQNFGIQGFGGGHRREGSPKSEIAAGHFFGILGICILAFPLTRSRELHIKSSKITKHEEVAEERFGISGSKISRRQ